MNSNQANKTISHKLMPQFASNIEAQVPSNNFFPF